MDEIIGFFGKMHGHSDCPAWLASADGTIVSANPAARGLFERDARPVPGRSDCDLVAEHFADRLQVAREDLVQGRSDHTLFHAAFLMPDGAERFLDCHLSPLDRDGAVVAILAQIRCPVTEAHAEPAESEATTDPNDKGRDPLQHFEILQKAAEAAGFGQWYFDIARRQMWATEAYFTMLGFRPDEVTLDSHWVRDRMHPDDRDSTIEAMDRLIHDRVESFRVDYRLRCKDGTYKWFEASARKFLRDDAGLPPLICGSLSDITVRKENEQRLADALATTETARNDAMNREDMLRVAASCGEMGAWTICPVSGDAWLLDEGFRQLGYAPGEFTPDFDGWTALLHPEDAAAAIQAMENVIYGRQEVFDSEMRLRHKDGSYRWYRTVARKIIRRRRGLPALIAGAFTNIDRLKVNEQRLSEALASTETASNEARTNAEMLRLAALCGEIGTWTICAELGETWMPDETFRQLGYEPGEFVPDDAGWRSVIHPDDLPEAIVAMDDLIFDRADVYAFEQRLLHKDGSYHWYRTIARKIDRTDQGLPPLVAGAHTCIDHVKENETRLAEALRDTERAREILKTREQMLGNTALVGGIGNWTVGPLDGDGWAPDETYALLGYGPGGFPSTHQGWRDLIHPDDLGSAIVEVEKLMDGRASVYEHEHRLRHEDGSYHWYRAVARIVDRSAQGLPFLLAGAVVAIDAVKENERRLAESAEAARRARDRLNTLADTAPVALYEYRIDTDGIVSFPYFSDKLPELLGVGRDRIEANGAHAFAHVPPEDLAASRESIAQSQETMSPYETRFRIQHPEKGLRWQLATSVPVAQPDGAVIWFGSIIDITEQLATERMAMDAAEEVRQAHERLNTLLDNAPGANFEYRVHPDGSVDLPYFSAKLPEIMGVPSDLIASDPEAFERNVHPADYPWIHETLERAGRHLTPETMLHRVNHPEKGLRWVLASVTPARQPCGAVVFYSSIIDVTERVEAEQRANEAAEEVRQAHEQLTSIANVAPVGIYQFRLLADGTGDFPYTSRRFEELVGHSREEIEKLKMAVFERIPFEDREMVLASSAESARTQEPWGARFRLMHPERGLIWLSGASIPRREKDGSTVFAGAIYDVTADVRREVELRRAHRLAEEMRAENERQALHDGLTGLPNRRHYDQMMARRIEQAEQGGPGNCALVRIDLDHFKYVNDTLGHEAGDAVLVRVAEVLRDCLRPGDLAARIGGDEFSILLGPSMTGTHARQIVERIQGHLNEPLIYDGRQCRFGASFGIAHTEDITQFGSELQLFADAALYRAKTGGRNRMEFFTPQLHRDILNDRRLALEIHEALEHDQFVPFFQPQVASSDGHLVGIEALLRWNHPTEGVLAPDAFMHVADQLRVIPEIDRIMMEKSRDSIARWRTQGLIVPKISFNISSGRMHDPDVVSLAREMVAGETRVTFELLESILVEEESEVFRFHLDMIRDAGIDIEIDDFGSGHASIIGLLEIAPSALKIDKRIVLPVEHDLRSRNLVRAIVEIAETLGIGTVAEGVETEEQANILRAIGCNVLQGYYFARPLCEEGFLQFAQAGTRRIA